MAVKFWKQEEGGESLQAFCAFVTSQSGDITNIVTTKMEDVEGTVTTVEAAIIYTPVGGVS